MPVQWCELPGHIVILIFRYLPISGASKAARTCSDWLSHFRSPAMWRTVQFNFYRGREQDKGQLRCIEFYGKHMRNLLIRLDQFEAENREMAIEVIKLFAKLPERQVQRLRVECTGENPLFYAGHDFIDALLQFADQSENAVKTLTHFDLSALPIAVTDQVLYRYSSHYVTLEYLDLQNKQLVCQITPSCIEHLAVNCPQLRDVRLFHTSLSNDVLLAFAEKNAESKTRTLNHLSLLCRREEKYVHNDLIEATWQALVNACPNLMVTLKFDYTCPLANVRLIMKSCIPVYNLFLETYTQVYPELEIVTDCYSRTLRKLVVQTQPSEELDSALVQLVDACHNLEAIHVMCTVDQETIDRIKERLPAMVTTGKFTLKNAPEPHPWVSDRTLDEIRTNSGWPRRL